MREKIKRWSGLVSWGTPITWLWLGLALAALVVGEHWFAVVALGTSALMSRFDAVERRQEHIGEGVALLVQARMDDLLGHEIEIVWSPDVEPPSTS